VAVIFLSLEGVAVAAGRSLGRLAINLDPDNAVGFFNRTSGLRLPDDFLTSNPSLGGAVSAAFGSAGSLDGLADAVTAASGDGAVIAAGATLLGRITQLLNQLGDIGTQLGAVPVPAGVPTTRLRQFGQEFGTFVPRYAIIEFFQSRIAGLGPTLSFLGLVDDVAVPPAPADQVDGYMRKELHPERLRPLISTPGAFLETLLGWGAPGLSFQPGQPLFDRLDRTLKSLGFPLIRVDDAGSLSLVSQKLTLSASAAGSGSLSATLGISVPSGIDVSGTLKPGLDIHLGAQGAVPLGTTVVVTPPATLTVTPASGQFQTSLSADLRFTPTSGSSFRLIGAAGGSGIEAAAALFGFGVELKWDGGAGRAVGELFATASLDGGKVVIDLSAGDAFLAAVTGGKPIQGRVDLGARYSAGGGLVLTGGGLQVVIPVHATFAGVRIDSLAVSFPFDKPGTGLPITFTVSLGASLGPFDLSISDVGLNTELSFPQTNGQLVDFDASFKGPTGVGVAVNAGAITGGGFLSIDTDRGRYAGVLELKVYGIAVKAFGLIETKRPDGSQGFSFVMVISAEFMPIQLGFGFTLLGVGGIVAINRTLNDDALRGALRDGSLDNLLFPADPARDAPTIIQNLASVFPAAVSHFIFGPTGKLGWGTPTLVHGDLGVVLELPGPRLAVLGVVRTSLPSEDFALVRLQLAIAGILDFPARKFSLDASLYDSYVGSFGVYGDMAFRLDFGGSPNFVLAIGGFNPSYKAPPGFPALNRVTIDLGVNGNPSLSAYGYLALTPNTAQVGAGIDLHAHGGGIHLDGHVGFDALFVFSPFSFTASIDAGVSVSFHGVGFGIHLHGNLSGPSPWHIDGEVCVSVLWWDACLGIGLTFGESRRAELPPVDPWFGPQPFDPQRPVLGLQAAIQDAHNWTSPATPGAQTVVSLAQRPNGVPTAIDPVGAATLRQKVVPLNQKITKFGEFSPVGHDTFNVETVLIGGVPQSNVIPVPDDFVPSHFRSMSSAERLSSKPYDTMIAGFSVDPHLAKVGTIGEKNVEYETVLLDSQRVSVPQPNYALTRRHLLGMLTRSAAALGGSRSSGIERYVSATAAIKVTLGPEQFAVADACTLAPNTALTGGGFVTQIAAALAIEAQVAANPGTGGQFAVVPKFELFI